MQFGKVASAVIGTETVPRTFAHTAGRQAGRQFVVILYLIKEVITTNYKTIHN